MKTPILFLFSMLVVAASLAGCSKNQTEPKTEPAAKALAPASAAVKLIAAPSAKPPAHAAAATDVMIEWTDPPEWKRVPPKNPMRKASYEIPVAAGEKQPAELSVFYFGPGQGGSADQNINRWTGQFKDLGKDAAERSERVVNDLTQHTVEVVSGTFSGTSMGPHAPPQKIKQSQGLLGAVVEAPSGMYFFKLSGPSKTVQAAKKPFFAMLDSVKAKAAK